jgi:asparagine synthase (glutamine-hydrolysing)
MYRFFTLVWDAMDSQSNVLAGQLALRLQRAAPGWQNVLTAPGVSAFHAGAVPLRHDAAVLANGTGVVFGKLFDKNFDTAPNRALVLSDDDGAQIAATGGRHLLDNYWGRYVAVVRDPITSRVRVLRDPSGALPCFMTTYRGVTLFFSDVEDCVSLGVVPLSINWDYIAACSAFISLRVGATGLKEVTEILHGEAANVGRNGVNIVQLWDPVEIARSQRHENSAMAVAEAQRLVKGCAQAWGSAHDSVMVSLSGGLDSSIVLTCLARTLPQTRITAFNNVFESGSGCDERRFARMAAEGLHCKLRERMLDMKAIRLERILSAARSAKPHFFLMDLIHGDFEHRLARETGATAVFSGSGGDHVFLQNCGRDAVGDFIYTHGLRPRLWSVARDAAHVTRKSAWFLLREGYKAARTELSWKPVGAKILNHFVAADVLERFLANPEFARPHQLRSATGLPFGKLRHIEQALIPAPFTYAFPEADSPDRIAPLFSQPVLELALRLPTYVLIHGGWDRGIERAAFAREVPPQIIRRRSKGVSDNAVRELIETNIEFVRELLLDGVLVRERMLDRKKLEAFLCGSRSGARTEYNELYVTRLCTEAWLRHWQGLERRAAA